MDSSVSELRKSHLEYDEVYFWTNTVKDWRRVFYSNDHKKIVLSSLRELVSRQKIIVYGFVLMPNHLHLIWEMKEPNGKEMPHASFNKFTSHCIIKKMRTRDPGYASQFKVDESDRAYRLWQRDALAVKMYNKKILEQKLRYIHNNPLQTHWVLVDSPEKYPWSSCRFYENGQDDFGFLTHYMDRF